MKRVKDMTGYEVREELRLSKEPEEARRKERIANFLKALAPKGYPK